MRCQLRQVEPGRPPPAGAAEAGESWPVDRPGIGSLFSARLAQQAGLIAPGLLVWGRQLWYTGGNRIRKAPRAGNARGPT